jgi:hypothetical protein
MLALMSAERIAKCACGAVQVACKGEPVRVSICHCLDCQRRTGSAFSYNATYAAEQVRMAGKVNTFTQLGGEGRWGRHSFCPTCGRTAYYEIEVRPGMVTVPVGNFADPDFPPPTVSVYGERRHRWVGIETDPPIEEA